MFALFFFCFVSRIMLLNLLNLFSLIIALFKKIYSMNKELDLMRRCGEEEGLHLNESTTLMPNISTTMATDTNLLATTASIYAIVHTATSELFPTLIPQLTTMATALFTGNVKNLTECVQIVVNCSKISKGTTKSVMTSFLALNFTSTILPEIINQLNGTEFNSTTISPWDMDSDIFHSGNLSKIYFDVYDDNGADLNATATTTIDAIDVYPVSSTMSVPLDDIANGDYETTTSHSDDYEYDDYGKFVIKFPYRMK